MHAYLSLFFFFFFLFEQQVFLSPRLLQILHDFQANRNAPGRTWCSATFDCCSWADSAPGELYAVQRHRGASGSGSLMTCGTGWLAGWARMDGGLMTRPARAKMGMVGGPYGPLVPGEP